MRFSKPELKTIQAHAQGLKKPTELARALKKSRAQTYRIENQLREKHMLGAATTHGALLQQLLVEQPSVIQPLSGAGLKLLTRTLQPKTIHELMKETGLKRSTVFKKLQEAKKISLIQKTEGKYVINRKIWSKAARFLTELRAYEHLVDDRVPTGSTIYFKNDQEIVFSTREPLEAEETAFSAYAQHGIKISTIKTYYYLPRKVLGKKELFQHALRVTEQEPSIQHLIFIALFYVKHKHALTGMHHAILENLKKILKGEHIPEYPTLKEIKDRARTYDITI